MDLVRRPEEFNVIVASNLFGDIATDIAAIVTGSLGLAPSGNVNPEGEYPSMFEPVHGNAMDIVGQGVANPLASVLTGAMLFDHLEGGESAAANDLRGAVEAQLADETAPRTPNLGGETGTMDVISDLSDRV